MPKTNQPKTIGSLNDFATTPQSDPDTDRIIALEKRVATIEMLLNDVMHQLDQPETQPKSKLNGNGKPADSPPLRSRGTSSSLRNDNAVTGAVRKVQKSKPPTPNPKKAKTKKTPPSEIITALLKQKPHSRSEMEAETGMDTEAVTKCDTWMKGQNLIEKTNDKDGDGNSRWGLKE